MQNRVIMALSAVLMLRVCLSADGNATGIDQLVESILKAPSWTEMTFSPEQSEQEGKKLLEALKPVAELEVEDARSVVEKLMLIANPESPQERLSVSDSLAIGSKIYVFNRLYFDVPEEISIKGVKYYGGWQIPTLEEGRFWIRYPLKKTAYGEVRIIEGYGGGYLGPPYRGLEEFDYFSETYPVARTANDAN